jgi:hypothetical protein
MPARNRYHWQVRRALEKDGWAVTHDPLRLRYGERDLFVDLGVATSLGAEKNERQIAVELQSFIRRSDIDDLQKALGQFILYEDVLGELQPERRLYLAVNEATYTDLFQEPIGQLVLKNKRVRLLVFDPFGEEVLEWIG